MTWRREVVSVFDANGVVCVSPCSGRGLRGGMRMRTLRLATVLFGVAFSLALPAAAGPFPQTIPLPDGFRPEGIAIGNGNTFYVGSLANGAVYRGDLRTGIGSILVSGQPGRVSVGIDFDGGLLYVAGGPTGQAYVYNAATGAPVADYQLTTGVSFINDVVVTKDAAYFTDSFQPVLYRVPLGGAPASEILTIPLGGDFTFVAGFNTNGIDATPDGKRLVIVNSTVGALYTVEPATGFADQIELSGGDVASGDGILLDGKTLYVVQNFLNQVAVVALRPDLSAGVIVDHKTNPAFDVPATIDEHGKRLYAVNARFTTPPTPDTTYSVVQFSKQ
jgi:hypothetical protein